MTDQRKVQLAAEMDATGVRKGTEEIKAATGDMARTVQQHGAAAAKGVESIGAGGDKAAGTLDRATKSIIGSIERTTAAMKAGEKGTAAYYETLASQRGVNGETLKPYLEQLRQAEAAQRAASGGLDRIGVSAKQTAAALRGVPAQFTDIITSLQGGQQPMTVFLQQGGQLKDMFGGAGAAARALGGYVLGLVNPFTLAAAAGAGLAAAYSMGASEAKEFQRTVILSGQAAGRTAGQLMDMAAGVRAMGAGTQGRAAEIINQLAASGAVGAENFKRFTAAALQMEQVGGAAAEETAKAFAELGKAPLQASLKLNESTNFLTTSLYQQIKALEDQGRTVEAARVAQDAYYDAVAQRAPQLLQTLGYIEQAWLGIKKAATFIGSSVLEIGRAPGPQGQLEELQRRLDAARTAPGSSQFYDADGNQVAGRQAALDSMRERIANLQQGSKYEALSAFYAAERAASVKASVEWDKESEKYLSKQAQAAREIAKVETLGVAAGKSRAEIEQQIAAIREKYADKAKDVKLPTFKAEEEAAKAYMRALDGLGKIALDATASADGLTKTQAKLREIQADPAWASYSRQQRERIIMDAAEAQSKEDAAAATKAAARAADEAGKAYAKWIGEMQRGADVATQQAEKLIIENEAAGLVIDGYRSLAQAIQVVEIARLRERQVAMMGDEGAVLAVEREIQARQRLIGLIGEKETREASEKSAKAAAREWEKVTDQIGQSLTDAIMSGGKTGAQLLQDLFRTIVLRPVLQYMVQGGTGYLSQVLGLAGSSGGGSGGQSLMSLFSAGSSAASAYGYLSSGYSALAGYLGGGATAGTGLSAAAGTYGSIGGTAGTYGSISGSIGTGTLGTGASAGSGAMSSLAAAAPYAAAVIAALAVSANAYSKGFTVQSVNSPVLESASPSFLTARALNSLGIGNDKWNNIFSGASGLSFLFGRGAPQVTDSGITGSIGGGDFSGQAFRDIKEKGGLFRSDKNYTQFAALTDDINKYLDVASKSVLDQAKEFGTALGLPAEQLAGISAQVRISLGTDAAKNQDAIAKALNTYNDALAGTFKAQIEPLRQYGETTAQAIERVGGAIKSVNTILGALGQDKLAASITSAQSAVDLQALFGGADGFSNAASTYLQAIYTDAERRTVVRDNLTTQLAQFGISLPASRAAFRDLVDAQDLNTEAGRRTYATLLSVAGAFGELTSAVAESGKAIQAEIDRLRGASSGTATTQAALLAQFGVTTAQARAGDSDALAKLPTISQALEKAAEATAGSALDIARMRAWLATSLRDTLGTVPGFAAGGLHMGGARLVGESGPELEVTGPARIYSSAATARMLGGNTDRLEAQIEALTAEVSLLTEAARATAVHTSKTSRLLSRAMPDGDALATRTAVD